MNKFCGPKDANFGLVSNDIREMVNEAKRISVSQREGIIGLDSRIPETLGVKLILT